jgi:hypothetical protein
MPSAQVEAWGELIGPAQVVFLAEDQVGIVRPVGACGSVFPH